MSDLLDIGFAEAFDMYRAAGLEPRLPSASPARKNRRQRGSPDATVRPPTSRPSPRSGGEPWDSNLGVAMPQDLIGIDVDQYGTKRRRTPRALKDRLGVRLPAAVRSSSSGIDNPSGIRLYRVPPGLDWEGELVPTSRSSRGTTVTPSCCPPSTPKAANTAGTTTAGEPFERPPWSSRTTRTCPGSSSLTPLRIRTSRPTTRPLNPAGKPAGTQGHRGVDRFPAPGRSTPTLAPRPWPWPATNNYSSPAPRGTRRARPPVHHRRREQPGTARCRGRVGTAPTGARYKARTTESTVLHASDDLRSSPPTAPNVRRCLLYGLRPPRRRRILDQPPRTRPHP